MQSRQSGFMLLLMSIIFPAASTATELIVKVIDEDEPLSMAEIILVDTKSRIIINNNFTNKSGVYQYTVNQGLYDITISKEEFSEVTLKNIEVKNTNIDKVVELIPAAFAAEVNALPSESEECD